jgi:hypothetical protein
VLDVAHTPLAQDTAEVFLSPDRLEDVCAGDDVGGAGLPKGVSGVSALDLGELIVAFAQHGDCPQRMVYSGRG